MTKREEERIERRKDTIANDTQICDSCRKTILRYQIFPFKIEAKWEGTIWICKFCIGEAKVS